MRAEVPMQPRELPHRDFALASRRQPVLFALLTALLSAVTVRATRIRLEDSETFS